VHLTIANHAKMDVLDTTSIDLLSRHR